MSVIEDGAETSVCTGITVETAAEQRAEIVEGLSPVEADKSSESRPPVPVSVIRMARMICTSHIAPEVFFSPLNYPEELCNKKNWVSMELTWSDRKNKFDKKPFRTGGVACASSTDSATWDLLDTVLKKMPSDHIPTIALTAQLGIVCIDIDHCMKKGVLSRAAQQVVNMFDGTYVERSASGDGVHIFTKGTTGMSGVKKLVINGEPLEIEVYSDKRFICMTGTRINSCTTIEDGTDSLAALEGMCRQEVRKPAERAARQQGDSTDGDSVPKTVYQSQLPISLQAEDIRKRLVSLDASDRSLWLTVGFALKRFGADNKCEGLAWEIFDGWSKNTSAGNYDAEKNQQIWDSLSLDHPNPVTVGTIVYLSNEAGYVADYSLVRAKVAEAKKETGGAHREKPRIELPSNMYTINDSAEAIFRRMAETMQYFGRGGAVCEVEDGELSPITPEGFRSRIEELGTTVAAVAVKDGFAIKQKLPSMDSAKALLESKAVRLLPSVEIITAAPILYKTDASVLVRAESGYCREAQAFVKGKHPPVIITAEEASREIKELFRDYQFVTPADNARALGFVVSVALQMGGFIPSKRCPMFIVEANDSQGGKGYMIETVSAIYNETPTMVAQKEGGVGSFDESFQQALVRGKPILCLDNLRGKVASAFIESTMTAPGKIGARLPGRGEIEVDPHRFVYSATSNGMISTPDLANRSIMIRIIKQPEDYQFHRWPEGDLIAHVKANQPRLLAGVHAIIMKWFAEGAYTADVSGHDYRDWHRVTQGVINAGWPEAGPLIDAEHRNIQKRVSDPTQTWMRELCKIVRLNQQLSATNIVEMCEDADLQIYRCTDEMDEGRKAKMVGTHMAKLFGQEDRLTIDDVQVLRYVTDEHRNDGKGYSPAKKYVFTKHGGSVGLETSPGNGNTYTPVTPSNTY